MTFPEDQIKVGELIEARRFTCHSKIIWFKPRTFTVVVRDG